MNSKFFGPAFLVAALSLCGVSQAEDGATSAVASAADYDDGPDFYLRGDIGTGFDGDVSAGAVSFDVEDSFFVQGGAGLDFGRLAIDVTASRESGGINLGVLQIDASETDYMANVELKLFEFAGGDVVARGGYGVADVDAGIAFGSVEFDGEVYALGGAYQYDVGRRMTFEIGGEFRNTDFEVGSTDAEHGRFLLRSGLRWG